MAIILPSEFDLHVLKRRGTNGRPDQFSIGVWDGVLTVRSVCHILPIDEVLAALRQLLESAGEVAAHNVKSKSHENTLLQPSGFGSELAFRSSDRALRVTEAVGASASNQWRSTNKKLEQFRFYVTDGCQQTASFQEKAPKEGKNNENQVHPGHCCRLRPL